MTLSNVVTMHWHPVLMAGQNDLHCLAIYVCICYLQLAMSLLLLEFGGLGTFVQDTKPRSCI